MPLEPDLSDELSRIRRSLGLSLSRAAERAGTSPATLSRYENGWSRFEVHTLRRLASALGYRVRITFQPLGGEPKRSGSRKAVERLGRLFWDRPLQVRDLKRYPTWVVGRVIELGTIDDIRLLVRVMGRAAFLATIRRIRMPSKRVATFWQSIVELEGVHCTTEHSRPPAAGSWPP